jgi:hypothetical protein
MRTSFAIIQTHLAKIGDESSWFCQDLCIFVGEPPILLLMFLRKQWSQILLHQDLDRWWSLLCCLSFYWLWGLAFLPLVEYLLLFWTLVHHNHITQSLYTLVNQEMPSIWYTNYHSCLWLASGWVFVYFLLLFCSLNDYITFWELNLAKRTP